MNKNNVNIVFHKHKLPSQGWLHQLIYVCQSFTDLVIDTVEYTRHNREEGGFEGFNVVHKKRNVPLEESDLGSKVIHSEL